MSGLSTNQKSKLGKWAAHPENAHEMSRRLAYSALNEEGFQDNFKSKSGNHFAYLPLFAYWPRASRS